MKRIAVYNLIIVIVIVLAMGIYYWYDFRKKEKILESLTEEFSTTELDDRFSGVVTSVFQGDSNIFRNHPHQVYVTLNDSVKKSIRTGYELSTGQSLDEVLQVGDALRKEPFTDTLYIFRVDDNDSITFKFQLNDNLGYPLVKIKKYE